MTDSLCRMGRVVYMLLFQEIAKSCSRY